MVARTARLDEPRRERKATVPDRHSERHRAARRRRRAAEEVALARRRRRRRSTRSWSAAGRSGSPAPGARHGAACGFGCSSATSPGAGASHVAAGMLAPVGEANWGEEALMRLGAGLGPRLAGLRGGARRRQRAGGRLRRLRRPPRRPRSRRGRGAAPPLRADGVARPRRRSGCARVAAGSWSPASPRPAPRASTPRRRPRSTRACCCRRWPPRWSAAAGRCWSRPRSPTR